MITHDKVPAPSSEYRTWQALTGPLPSGLQSQFIEAFSNQFELKQKQTSSALQLKETLSQLTQDKFSFRTIDHALVFRHMLWGVWVVVTQPYGTYEEKEPAIAYLEDLGCEIVDLRQWEFYYPTKAICLGIVVSDPVARNLKSFRANSDSSRGHLIFNLR